MDDATVIRYASLFARFRAPVRVVALAVITALVAAQCPQPGLHGRGLVILITLVLTVLMSAGSVLAPERLPTVRVAVEVLACGILSGFDPGTTGVLLVFVGLDAASNLPPSSAAGFTAVAIVTQVLATVIASNPATDTAYSLAAAGGFLLGSTIRQSALRAEQAELRLADLERVEIERTRSMHLAERANAAREIHDVLAHSLGALIVQLDAVNGLMAGQEPDLDAIRPILRDAHQNALDGLSEARDAVRSLRDDVKPLETSIRQLTDGNPGISLRISGPTRPVPADVAYMVRRIVQEAVTNATKHASGSPIAVQLDFSQTCLDVIVSDSGRPPDVGPSVLVSTGGGYGLQGMRERAEMIGASLCVGPDTTGWRVHLSVPFKNGPR